MTQSELDGFWQATLQRAAMEPLDAVVEPVKDPQAYYTHRVTYRSLDGIKVRAYLGQPIIGERSGGKLPAIVTVPGYGGWEFGSSLSECQRGYILMQVFPRSQGESGELWKVEPGA